MNNGIIIVPPVQSIHEVMRGAPNIEKLFGISPLQDIKTVVGGMCVAYPFLTEFFNDEGNMSPCIAYADEDGYAKHLAVNCTATYLYQARQMALHGAVSDDMPIVGNVAFVVGSKQFVKIALDWPYLIADGSANRRAYEAVLPFSFDTPESSFNNAKNNLIERFGKMVSCYSPFSVWGQMTYKKKTTLFFNSDRDAVEARLMVS